MWRVCRCAVKGRDEHVTVRQGKTGQGRAEWSGVVRRGEARREECPATDVPFRGLRGQHPTRGDEDRVRESGCMVW